MKNGNIFFYISFISKYVGRVLEMRFSRCDGYRCERTHSFYRKIFLNGRLMRILYRPSRCSVRFFYRLFDVPIDRRGYYGTEDRPRPARNGIVLPVIRSTNPRVERGASMLLARRSGRVGRSFGALIANGVAIAISGRSIVSRELYRVCKPTT